MEILTNFWLWLAVFIVSGGYILYLKKKERENVHAQFVITGTLLIVFYAVCFCSGICTILNFIRNWFF